MHMRRILLPALVAGALLLAACGGGGDDTTATSGNDATVATTSADTTSTAASDTTGGQTDDDTTPSSTADDDTSTGSSGSSGAPAGATKFTDPGGAYSISVNPSWEPGSVSSPKMWFTAPAKDGFRDNTNVIIENLPSKISLDDYLKLSLRNAPTLIKGFSVKSQDEITLGGGDKAIRVIYTGSVSNSPEMQFLAIVAVNDKRAATVTFTAPPSRFEQSLADVEPYLRTLDVT